VVVVGDKRRTRESNVKIGGGGAPDGLRERESQGKKCWEAQGEARQGGALKIKAALAHFGMSEILLIFFLGYCRTCL
jgi:hypothetical protein